MSPAWLGDNGSGHGGFEEGKESLGVGENKQATIVSGGGNRDRATSSAWLGDGGPTMVTLKRERERERLKREKNAYILGNKIYYLGLKHCYSTIINLGWYCSKFVNIFRIAIPGNASFMGFDAKF